MAESGIHGFEDIEKLTGYGATAFLVGESLMRRDDIKSATERLLGMG